MKPFQSEGKLIKKETPCKIGQGLKIQPFHLTNIKTPPKEQLEGQDSGDKDEYSEKFSMSKLCACFVQKFNHRKDKIFSSKNLVKEFGIKQRRIYDLMNIMEGCGCLKKLSKGRYEWVGVKKSQFVEPESQKGDSTSLRQISAKIKLVFSELKQPVKFSDINELLINENKDKGDKIINPASIRRRIYECCKVLRILGYIDKMGKYYHWVFNNQQPQIQVSVPQVQRQRARRPRRLQLTQRELVTEIVRRYKTPQSLNQFIDKVRSQFSEPDQTIKKEVISKEQFE